MTRPPTSPPAIVRCGDTPVFQSAGDRREQHKRKPRLISTSASQAAKSALKERRHKARPRPEECAGVARPRQSPSAIVTIRHDVPYHVMVWSFGWPFRHPGRTPRKKKNDLGELYMTQTRPRSRKGNVGLFVGARSKTATWGVHKHTLHSACFWCVSVRRSKLVYASFWPFFGVYYDFQEKRILSLVATDFFLFGPGRARREQPNAGLHLGVRAFVRSVSHVKVFFASFFSVFWGVCVANCGACVRSCGGIRRRGYGTGFLPFISACGVAHGCGVCAFFSSFFL